MLRWSEMVAREDFVAGPLRVSPSRRLVEGSQGTAQIEPRVLQVLLCLLDGREAVVTRETLFEQCWGGVPVGDDSINRAVAKLRQALELVAPEVEIETIPRTGYRLTGIAGGEFERLAGTMNRRTMVGGGIALAAIAGVAGFGYLRSGDGMSSDPEVTALLDKADRALRDWFPKSGERGETFSKAAIERDPDNARAWGLLALSHRRVLETGGAERTQERLRDGLQAAARALAIDPNEGNALTAKATLQPEFGNWGQVERDLRSILRVAPENVHALAYMSMMMQEVGRSREGWDFNERVIALDPLSPTAQHRRALKQWIFGRSNQAILTNSRALQTWPRYTTLWVGRFYILIFSGRAADALRLLRDDQQLPPDMQQATKTLLGALARAIDTSDPAAIENARRVMLDIAPGANAHAAMSMMRLAHLGLVDDAFAVTEGRLLARGPLAGAMWPDEDDPDLADHHWIRTMNLFTPAMRSVRIDPRFDELTEAIGMKRYWKEVGVGPDAFLMR